MKKPRKEKIVSKKAIFLLVLVVVTFKETFVFDILQLFDVKFDVTYCFYNIYEGLVNRYLEIIPLNREEKLWILMVKSFIKIVPDLVHDSADVVTRSRGFSSKSF